MRRNIHLVTNAFLKSVYYWNVVLMNYKMFLYRHVLMEVIY